MPEAAQTNVLCPNITSEDVPALLDVRASYRENAHTRERLTALGITHTSVREKLRSTYAGGLCEIEGKRWWGSPRRTGAPAR